MAAMQALRDIELVEIASDLQALVGAQLQDAVMTGHELGLAFYHDQRIVWLWFDMEPRRPLVLWFDKEPPRTGPKQTKPLLLFTRAHLFGKRLKSVAMNVGLGRVLEFDFHDPEGTLKRLEARLFPGGANLSVVVGDKSVSLNKPKPVPAKPPRATTSHASQEEATEGAAPDGKSDSTSSVRSWQQICEQWREVKAVPRASTPSSASGVALELKPDLQSGVTTKSEGVDTELERARQAYEKTYTKALAKKTQAVERLRQELETKRDPSWREAGEWMKTHPHALESAIETAPAHLRARLDPSRSVAWNIEHCFQKAKDNERKLLGTSERLRILERELADLRNKGVGAAHAEAQARLRQRSQTSSGGSLAMSLLERSGARGRKLPLGEDLEAYIGKSAADNMALLRRAQPHDLWLHLRDYPGAHAILRRPKNRVVTDAELNEVGRWLVVQSLHKPEAELAGGRFDLILAECRHVRPIKGDRLGRVHYQNDRLFVVRL